MFLVESFGSQRITDNHAHLQLEMVINFASEFFVISRNTVNNYTSDQNVVSGHIQPHQCEATTLIIGGVPFYIQQLSNITDPDFDSGEHVKHPDICHAIVHCI